MLYDIIFAGGGTTACVVAGRLASANPSLKILIIESGQHSLDVPNHVEPARYLENFKPDSPTVYFHVGKPSMHLNGRAPAIASGKGVGGGSIVNFMCYTRGAASDFDDWAAFGNQGWNFDDLLPLIKKLETFTPIPHRSTHGYSGPITVGIGGIDLGLSDQFLNVARAYDPARPQADDCNDFETADAYSLIHKYIDPVTGRRSDAASRYLYPQSDSPNLRIIVGKRVKRVIVENGRAVGIEYTTDGKESNGEVVRANSRKLVIVSAGAFGSPAILERSGIGNASVLTKFDIPVLANLAGVGENYLDHFGTGSAYNISDKINSMKDVWSDSEAYNELLQEWKERGTGKVAHNGMEGLAKFRLTKAELASTGSALQRRWETFFKPQPDKTMSFFIPFAGHPFATTERLMSGFYFDMYPESVGSVHIMSGDDANAPQDFNPNLFSESSDVELLTWMYKRTREIHRRMPAYRGEAAAYHPKFPPGSAAACKESTGPVPIDAPDLVYSDADDQAIVNFHRDTLMTVSHSLGTCAMKPRDQGGVVDASLNVYGVEGLKVADLSICPSNVGNNTYFTALLIGEKAATIIAKDLGLDIQDD